MPEHDFEHPMPKESPAMWALFNQFLALGPQRTITGLACQTGHTEKTLRTYAARFHWFARVAHYAEHLACIEREATEATARTHAADRAKEWLSRRDSLRQEEWSAHQECLAAAQEALARFHASQRTPSLSEVARLLELASKLGRLAAAMPTDHTEVTGTEGGPIRIDIQAALRKVYGEVIDVEAAAQLPQHATP